jgi:hypothetical protein
LLHDISAKNGPARAEASGDVMDLVDVTFGQGAGAWSSASLPKVHLQPRLREVAKGISTTLFSILRAVHPVLRLLGTR